MANGYMPRQDAAAAEWFRQFKNGLSSRPEIYKVDAGVVASVSDAIDTFLQAFARTNITSTRTSPAIAGKDDARLAAEIACRPVYARIKLDSEISNEDKAVIGVRPVNPSRSRIAAPNIPAKLLPGEMLGYGHQLVYFAPDTNPGHAKPRGTVGVQVFRHLGTQAINAPTQLDYVGTYTRNPINIPYPMSDDLKIATYYARWIDRKGQTGPWGNPCVLRVSLTTQRWVSNLSRTPDSRAA